MTVTPITGSTPGAAVPGASFVGYAEALPGVLGTMTTADLTVGRVVLMERPAAVEQANDSGVRSVAMMGREWGTRLGHAVPRTRGDGLLGYAGQVVPVSWGRQSWRNGWYRVGGVQATEVTQGGGWSAVEWSASLDLVGLDSEVEVESRLSGGNRVHASAATAELWHAPAIGHSDYLVGTSTPGYVDRMAADGTVRVYRSIPADTHPRWSVPAVGAMAGAVSVTVSGVVRTATACPDAPASWVLSNGLLKVEPRTSAGTLRLTPYLTSGWGTPKVVDIKRGTTSLGAAQHVTILRNDACECVIRLTWDHAPGRTVADLTLARGARHVGLFIQQYAAPSALRIDDDGAGGTVSNQLTAAGYVERTDADADGNRWVLGSAVAATAAGTFGLAANVAALGLPAYIGVVRAGASAVAGDTAAQVNAQYLGAPTQAERVAKR